MPFCLSFYIEYCWQVCFHMLLIWCDVGDQLKKRVCNGGQDSFSAHFRPHSLKLRTTWYAVNGTTVSYHGISYRGSSWKRFQRGRMETSTPHTTFHHVLWPRENQWHRSPATMSTTIPTSNTNSTSITTMREKCRGDVENRMFQIFSPLRFPPILFYSVIRMYQYLPPIAPAHRAARYQALCNTRWTQTKPLFTLFTLFTLQSHALTK